jgi:hypothetical protein
VNDTRTPPLASNQGKRQKRGRNPPSQAYESRPPQRIQKTIVTLHLQASLNIPDTGWTCRRAWTLELEGGSATRRSICTLDQATKFPSNRAKKRGAGRFSYLREPKPIPGSPIQDSSIHDSCDSCSSDSHHAAVETSCPSLVAHPYSESSRFCADEAQMT